MPDFFVVRDAIKAEIEDKLPELKRVYFAEDLDGVQMNSQHAPAVHVLFSGYVPAQAERVREDITVDQTWTVVLVTRNARGDYKGGEELYKLIQVLHGFKPSAEGISLALQLEASPFSPSYRPGVALYPLAFSTRVINRKGA